MWDTKVHTPVFIYTAMSSEYTLKNTCLIHEYFLFSSAKRDFPLIDKCAFPFSPLKDLKYTLGVKIKFDDLKAIQLIPKLYQLIYTGIVMKQFEVNMLL